MACFFFLLFPTLIFAKILKDEVSLVSELKFSFNQVCKSLTKRESPLIEYKSVSEIDCMGTIVEVRKYCERQLISDPYYIRAVVDKENKNVICKSAKKVILKYQCEKGTTYCEDSEIGCFRLQEKLATRLKLEHHSITEEKKNKILNCYFMPKKISKSIKSPY